MLDRGALVLGTVPPVRPGSLILRERWDVGRTVTDEQRTKIIRLAALALIHHEVPGAPAGAIGPPSKWWSEAELIVDAIMPYVQEALRGDV